uniref:WD domain-containing protein, G-beta repeat-containing protein n=1 Tax=Candidatus Kentrum sp. LPFa TaxID=2126335 RepID=A0A450WUC5_9GAMM|nr:MAG: WD domain-containing protein, G-beta repeat-containing protein [Candidatus Kentron sp. LPFa]
MLLLLTEGKLVWDRTDYNWDQTTALPDILKGQFKHEPLYVDLRWAKTEDKLSLRHSRFRSAVLDVAAPLHGKPKDELDSEDVRQHRWLVRIIISITVVLIALTVLSAIMGRAAWIRKIEAERQQEIAKKERNVAIARQLAVQSMEVRGNRGKDLVLSALLAVESLKHSHTFSGYLAWNKAINLLPQNSTDLNGESILSFSPSGERLATVNRKGIGIWNAADGVELIRKPYRGTLRKGVFSPNGRYLATVDLMKNRVLLWDVEKGIEFARLPHRGQVEDVIYNDPGTRLVTVSRNKAVYLWDADTGMTLGRMMHEGDLKKGDVENVIFSPDGTRLATGGWYGTVDVWDAATNSRIIRLAHKGARVVRVVSLSQDGEKLLTESGRDVWVWDVPTGEILFKFHHGGKVSASLLNATETHLATANELRREYEIHLWEGI